MEMLINAIDPCLICTFGQLSARWNNLCCTQGMQRGGKTVQLQMGLGVGSKIREVDLENQEEMINFLMGKRVISNIFSQRGRIMKWLVQKLAELVGETRFSVG